MPIERAPADTMPDTMAQGRGDPRLCLRLTPHRSLTPEGFVWFIALTAGLISMPLFGILGTSVFWALLPFLVFAIWGIWAALQRSWRDMDLYEDVAIWQDLIRVERHQRKHASRVWEANPYWIRVVLHPKAGPVPNYLTLQGGPREVELGAFLSPAERGELKRRLERALRA
jgi:uncharacterized membrane protein